MHRVCTSIYAPHLSRAQVGVGQAAGVAELGQLEDTAVVERLRPCPPSAPLGRERSIATAAAAADDGDNAADGRCEVEGRCWRLEEGK